MYPNVLDAASDYYTITFANRISSKAVLYNWKRFTLALNSSLPGQNDRNFADDIIKCIFMIEKFFILIIISLNFVTKGRIYNKPAMIQIMAWRRIGDKPSSEPMLTSSTDAYMRQKGEKS